MAFVAGQSGNPGGRPKDDDEIREVKALAKQHSKTAILKLVEWMQSGNAKASVAACNSILDRGLGKPVQELAGEGGGALQIIVQVASSDAAL